MLIYYFNNFAQISLSCGKPELGIDVTGSIPFELIPLSLTDDTWGTPIFEKDRTVFFIHGLGGQGDEGGDVSISWSQAALWSGTFYKINPVRPDYSDVSLLAAAEELKGDLEANPGADPNAYIIAHSQGGIVSRRVDYAYYTGEWGFEPRSFGGLVTFGSPHQGAKILNNKDDLLAWTGITCEALTEGPYLEVISDHFFLNLLLTEEVTQTVFEDYFCGSIENNIAPLLFKDYYSGITESYEVGSPQITELNEFIPEIPYVCFYGVEDEPALWNTLVHILPNREPNNTITYGEDAFGSGNDQSLVEYADIFTDKYFAYYTSWNLLVELMDLADDGFFGFYFGDPGGEGIAIRDAYENGFDWWIDANYAWRGFIGEWEFVETGKTCYCMEDGPLGDLSEDVYEATPDGACITDDYNTDCYLIANYESIIKESDGIVLEESARECLGQIDITPGFERKMKGSNHFSMRNDNNTELMLMDLYNGVHGYFFQTSLR